MERKAFLQEGFPVWSWRGAFMTIAALDPGRDKCGFAVLDDSGKVCMQQVIETAALEQRVQAAYHQYHFNRLVEGNGTTSSSAFERLERPCPAWISCWLTSIVLRNWPRGNTGRPTRSHGGACCQ